MIKFIVSLLLILFSINVFALDIKAEIELKNEKQLLKEGDVFPAVLRLWPLPDAHLSTFSSLENQKLFGSFLVLNVASVKNSVNNADVVEVEADLIFTDKDKYAPISLLKIGQLEVKAELRELKTEYAQKKLEEYVLQDQRVSWSKAWLYSSLIILISATLAFFFRSDLYKFFDKHFKFTRKAKKKMYSSVFLSAKNRADYEAIYKNKNKWLELYEKDQFHVQEFFKTINSFQYQPDWSAEELAEVQKSFEVIRRSFE